jgi:hypothetical protein
MRSAVTNGKRLFVEGDGNTKWSRRYRDLVAAHVVDLGGPGLLSEAQASLVRRASAIEVELEEMEGKLSMSLPVDLDLFTRSASHLRRILETLGVERRPKDVTPPLREYLGNIERDGEPYQGEGCGLVDRPSPFGGPRKGRRRPARAFKRLGCAGGRMISVSDILNAFSLLAAFVVAAAVLWRWRT